MSRTAAVAALVVVGLCGTLTGCSSNTTSCARSGPLADGSAVSVDVMVASKGGARYLGVIDVNAGLYVGPMRTTSNGSGPLTDLAAGSHVGRVRRDGDRLTLTVRGQAIPLTGPQACD